MSWGVVFYLQGFGEREAVASILAEGHAPKDGAILGCGMASRVVRGRGQYLGDPITDRGGSCPYPGELYFIVKDSMGVKLWLLSWRKEMHPRI